MARTLNGKAVFGDSEACRTTCGKAVYGNNSVYSTINSSMVTGIVEATTESNNGTQLLSIKKYFLLDIL